MITVEKQVIQFGQTQIISFTGNIKHQDGMVIGTSKLNLTTISILVALNGVSKFTKLFCKDGVPTAHFMLLNQSTNLKINQSQKPYKLFIKNQESLFKNIQQMLGLLCTTPKYWTGEFGTTCSEMMTWIMLLLIFIGIKHSLPVNDLKTYKMHVMSMKPQSQHKLII